MAYLAKRGVHTNGYCPRCQKCPETMVQALWGCRELRSVREKCQSFKSFEGSNDMHFLDFILGWLRNLCSSEMEFMDVVQWASDFIDEWRSTSQVGTLPTSCSAPVQNWIPPMVGSWKLNTDAATCYMECLIGLGCIIRDSVGVVRAAVVKKITAMVPPLMVEAMAVRRGIQLAASEGIGVFHIETDSLQVAELVRKRVVSYADVGPIINDILSSLDALPRCSISHISRRGNLAAHSLAREALSVIEDCVWVDRCPPCVVQPVHADVPV
ncbi:hypothetical protein LWI29_017726 [Acer saccharum]|uniref:RNase H type-1 domain-containing protein n=1 Tax=Acer saccharum TaxID=4024 RepID=A0AA39SYL1_ACESA|nr:hypothetical protein LWI29_017726 [Acer saccharum]